MADVHDKKTRSYNMSQIKAKDTKPEMIVRKFLHNNGYRYRLHDKKLPGKPDIILKKYESVVFVHGCFWHGHEGCKYFVIPKTRTDWWRNKIFTTKRKDLKNYDALKKNGWKVHIVWECELKSNKVEETLKALLKKLKEN